MLCEQCTALSVIWWTFSILISTDADLILLTDESKSFVQRWRHIFWPMVIDWYTQVSKVRMVGERVRHIRRDVDDVTDIMSAQALQVSRVLGVAEVQVRQHFNRKRLLWLVTIVVTVFALFRCTSADDVIGAKCRLDNRTRRIHRWRSRQRRH